MLPRPIRHRRARRTDFAAIGAILAASGLPAAGPDRAALRRFRRLVADLGADLYVAECDGQLLGVAHVVYTRHLTGAPQARLVLLVVDPAARSRGAGRTLAELAAARARRRGCTSLRCCAATTSQTASAFLTHAGWRVVGEELEFDLADPAQ